MDCILMVSVAIFFRISISLFGAEIMKGRSEKSTKIQFMVIKESTDAIIFLKYNKRSKPELMYTSR